MSSRLMARSANAVGAGNKTSALNPSIPPSADAAWKPCRPPRHRLRRRRCELVKLEKAKAADSAFGRTPHAASGPSPRLRAWATKPPAQLALAACRPDAGRKNPDERFCFRDEPFDFTGRMH